MNFSPKKKRQAVTIDLTPLIDAVFLLLIFFAVTTSFIATPGIRVNLPGSTTAKMEQDKKELTITITAAGEIIFEREFVSLTALEGILSKVPGQEKQLLVIVRADKEVRHGRVVGVLDRVKKSGFQRIALATRNAPRKK